MTEFLKVFPWAALVRVLLRYITALTAAVFQVAEKGYGAELAMDADLVLVLSLSLAGLVEMSWALAVRAQKRAEKARENELITIKEKARAAGVSNV